MRDPAVPIRNCRKQRENIKKAKGTEFVASVQLAGFYKMDPGPDALTAIKAASGGEKSRGQMAAARYLKDSGTESAPIPK